MVILGIGGVGIGRIGRIERFAEGMRNRIKRGLAD
jgi:hypothetical protein